MSDSRDPIMLQLSRHLPVHQVTKYKHTNHAIVVQLDTPVHTVRIVLTETLLNIESLQWNNWWGFKQLYGQG